jgi:hypothetical protein
LHHGIKRMRCSEIKKKTKDSYSEKYKTAMEEI